MKNNFVITVIVAVVVGAAAFFGGMKYQQSKVQTASSANGQFGQGLGNGQGGQFGQRGNRNANGARATQGQIISTDNNSITVKLQDGSSKIVIFSDSTQISKSDKATKDDLKTGENVAVFGTTNSDGSVTAQTIQLNPMFRGMGNGGNGTPTPSNKLPTQ